MATHSSIPAWRIPWTEEPGGLQSMWSQRVDTTEQLNRTELIEFVTILLLFHVLLFLLAPKHVGS